MAVPTLTAAPAVRLRAAAPADDTLLHGLFVDGRPELRLLPPALVELQVVAQRAQYRRNHPDATDEIVEVAGEAVGRCWTATDGDELHVLDLAVCPDRRGQGIGRAVLDVLADRAAAAGRAIQLTVWSANAGARRLYRAVGFTETGSAGGHVVMRLEPGAGR